MLAMTFHTQIVRVVVQNNTSLAVSFIITISPKPIDDDFF